jgi:hypothetical protein
MPAGTILKEIHGDLVGIDGQGNLVLNTQNKLGEQIVAGNRPGVVGLGIASAVTISNTAGGTQYYSLVTFQAADVFGNAVKAVFDLDLLLSDAATGAGLTGTTASGGISVTTGTQLLAMVASKALRVQTDVNGKAVMQIIDSAKTGFYPVSSLWGRGYSVGAALTASSYHA